MTFISLGYIFFFFPMVLSLYNLLRTTAFANFIILGASYYFYGSSGIFLLIPLMISSFVDFYVGHKLDESNDEKFRKKLLIFSILVNMGILVFFKYAVWMMQSANLGLAYFHIPYAIPIINIPMLPGVSFYTFQTMSYTIDIYRREMKASRNVINYMTFVTFWPHLVAGPIMRAKNLLQQLESVRPSVTADTARYALLLICWGLFKKVALADNFGYFVEQINNQISGGTHWAGAGLLFSYAFAGQIYCDFSAYTTIARGCAKFIGVDLVRNFHTPYFSATPSEFWRRWHISLSSWLRDYVYIPLGGNRNGTLMQCRNFIITMFLGGLWHGAGILFIAWGLWHGFLLALYRIIPIENFFNRFKKVGRLLLIFLMFQLTCFGWLLFRADSTTILPLWQTIIDMFSMKLDMNFHYYAIGIFSLGAFVLFTDYIGYRKDSEFEDLFAKAGPKMAIAILLFCYFAIMLLGKREGAQFVYFQF